MKTFLWLVAGVLAFVATSAHAGWTSSGGRMLSDEGNPWWVQNTTDVAYCVELDAGTFSASGAQVDQAFQRALAFWRSQISSDDRTSSQAHLITQNFTKVACGDDASASNVSLRLKLGEGSLAPDERAYFGDRLKYFAAVAVRTDYDEVNLAGKGFIFVAGDQTKPSHPWSEEARLTRVFVHELGHVFGLPHITGTVMDESAPGAWFAGMSPVRRVEVPDFVQTPTVPERCSMAAGGSDVFVNQSENGPLSDFACLNFLPIAGRPGAYKVTARPLVGGIDIELGELAGRFGMGGVGKLNLVSIFLNARQRVFTVNPNDPMIFGDLLGQERNKQPYVFRSNQGWEKPVYLHSDMRGSAMYIAQPTTYLGETYEIVVPGLTRLRRYGDFWDED